MKVQNIIRLVCIAIVTVIVTTLSVISAPLNYFGKVYHYHSRIWAILLVRIAGVKIKTSNLENIKPNVSYLIVSNHASLYDIPILLSCIKNELKMIAKKELMYIPFLGLSLFAGNYIFIDRNSTVSALRAVRKAKKLLKENKSILLFPEGTRSSDGVIGKFKKGAFVIAKGAKVPIIPVSIYGSDKIMRKGSLALRPSPVYVKFGKPIYTNRLSSEENANLLSNLRDLIKKDVADMELSLK